MFIEVYNYGRNRIVYNVGLPIYGSIYHSTIIHSLCTKVFQILYLVLVLKGTVCITTIYNYTLTHY